MPTEIHGLEPYFARRGVLNDVLVMDYVGDDVLSRELDLGDDYYVVMIVLQRNRSSAQDSLGVAMAVGDWHWVDANESVLTAMEHYQGIHADPYFQGKMTGADATKVKLGTAVDWKGTNKLGETYRVLAYKFFRTR